MTDDRPGIFSKVAGVLALHGLDVVQAAAHSTDEGRALAEFRVVDPCPDETAVGPGRRRPRRSRSTAASRSTPASPSGPHLRQPASTLGQSGHGQVPSTTTRRPTATVIDVQAPDGIGVLYRITRALAELDVDIRSARLQTLGHQVIDAFYVRDARGEKVTDKGARAEIERAILHGLSE